MVRNERPLERPKFCQSCNKVFQKFWIFLPLEEYSSRPSSREITMYKRFDEAEWESKLCLPTGQFFKLHCILVSKQGAEATDFASA